MAPNENRKASKEPIAVIGSACRFPGGSTSPSKLWTLLRDPRDVLKEIPSDRFSVDGFYHPDNMHHGTSNVRHSYMLDEDIRVFDSQFFGIKPVEANSIDPQQRLLMETVYESIESAGLPMSRLKGSQTAVYVGLMSNDYGDMLGHDKENFPTYFATGTARSIVSNRVSYFFDWHGPSMTIDTACSSSLVAVHQAVQVLRSGDGTDLAIAAGTNLLLNPDQYIAESKLKMLSPNGRSRMWDEKANGYARGDGIAVVVLKRLSQAIKDGDHIECLIRETQTNQDGRTKGITMPSPIAQTALIRATYQNAGLDLTKASDRPQFFEAHGTGTPAGDPIEAEAIHTAFFGQKNKAEPLSVGSIKTIVGHTEGTAGLAALLKASLAVQSGVIPPNLLFDKVNPRVQPFYGDLQIQRKAQPWPSLAAGAVRRASVNSFGFGGANAHAIIEAYTPVHADVNTPAGPIYTTLNLSAASETALKKLLLAYADHLDENPSINLASLAWTVNTRRSTFPVRTSVFGSTAAELSQALRDRSQAEKNTLSQVPPKSLSSKPRVLGVFTGQGAQWKQMGAQLLATSPQVVAILNQLEASLAELPDGPAWSIKSEILADEATSRINEAAISQPLCTAVQVVLVDLLRSSGIQFEAVVGHSSGEIGAAYAAGYLSASDAIRVAYYRGLHLHLAQGLNGMEGAMMAVGTSFDDAQQLCNLRAFKGRIGVAASNSSASVTISGDKDAILWAKDVLDDEKKFARLLKVDKAYHSHHMHACSDSYRQSLIDCGIKVHRPSRTGTTWISSVYGEDTFEYRHQLGDEYWIRNMVQPVLFSQALEYAVAEKGSFDIAIECGPHPALKGPALQVIQEYAGASAIPYTGLLSRSQNDVKALADGLGYIWQALGEDSVDYGSFSRFIAGPYAPEPRLLPNLPSYQWDHDRVFWHESRQYAANRTKPNPTHELLGTICPDATEKEQRWRNMLRPKEIPWLSGHRIQDQMVFPAAGYVSAALEAVKLTNRGRSIQAIEIQDFVIGQAIAFNDEYASIETQLSLTNIHLDQSHWTADFSFYSASPKNSGSLDLNASGSIVATLGEPQDDLLPPHPEPEFNMLDVDLERFYESLKKLGFGYTGPFKALGSLKRRMGVATGTITNPTSTDPAYNLLLHPATFDNAIQSIILAYCYPNDNRLWSVHLPTGIKKIKFNTALCERYAGQAAVLSFKSVITDERSSEIQGDVDVYDEAAGHALMQLEGLQTQPLGNATAANDSALFLETIWDIETPSRERSEKSRPDMQKKSALCFDIERVAFFYLRNLDNEATREDREKAESYHKIFFEYIDHTVADVKRGTAQFAQREWLYDTHDQILALIHKHSTSLDMRLMHAVGEHLLPVVRGETTMLEFMREDNLLNDFYVHAAGFDEYTESLAQQVSQFTHRYPHMNVLEIGAGTGGATKRIFGKLGKKFASYTYTDISTGFFEKARETFHEFESKMTFKALNAEKDPVEQGFTEHSYDLIVASLVLHATHDMDTTMQNVRRLLKPGGYLVMLELGDYIEMRTGLIFGSLPGWWMGYDDGRKLSPCLSEQGWSDCMKRTGFSGVDAIVPRQENLPISLAVITGQAVDEKVNFLREPLTTEPVEVIGSHLTIIGGSTPSTSQLVENSVTALMPFYDNISVSTSLADLHNAEVPFMGTVLCLVDLDDPIFRDLQEGALTGAQQLFKQTKNCLWVTQGARDDNPYQNMSLGLGRVAKLEMTHLRLQSLDFDTSTVPTADAIVKRLLQLEAIGVWEQKSDTNNMLWSLESEVAYDHDQVIIPRLVPNATRNNRYNSTRRVITKQLDPESSPLSLRWSGKSFEIHEEPRPDSVSLVLDGRVQLQVIVASIEAVRITETDFAHLVLAQNIKTQQQVIALAPQNHSIVRVFDSWTVPYDLSQDEALALLPSLLVNLKALSILSGLSSGETLVLVEPEEKLGHVVSGLATERGIKSVILTSNPDRKGDYLHPNAPKRIIQSVLPRNATFVFPDAATGLTASLSTCLPANAKILKSDSISSKTSRLDSFSAMAFAPSTLRTAFVRAHRDNLAAPSEAVPVMLASDISPSNQPSENTTFVKWVSDSTVPVHIVPVDAGTLFSADKTYWLVGLSGGLGQSLCEWMVKRGARHVVITSRNPQVHPNWEKHMGRLGAVVKIYANDITDRDSVAEVYRRIRDEMPPIGGVAQGAMVLADTMFMDMDLARVQKVVGPKVNGTRHLEELFANTDLEFFVFFSSMAYVTGNQGQSIYAAANAYMTALAAQRRKRGLAGSAINIGTIIGNGYVTRQLTVAQQEYLTHMGNVFMSEQDFHQIFAEAVVAGRPSSTDIPEIMTGLRPAHLDDADKVTWFHNPKFSHCVLLPENQGAKVETSKRNVTVRAQLLLATTKEEAKEIIEESLANKLRSSLQIESSVSVVNMNADQLGLDSLVAVDIRSWFIKELNVEMPVLKILGGFTVAEIVDSALEKLSESLVPNLGKEIDPSLKVAVKGPVDPVPVLESTPVSDNNGAFDDHDEEDDEDNLEMVDSVDATQPLKKVGFSDTSLTPSSKSSDDGSVFDSDSENVSIRKPALSTATSISAMDDYFSKKDDMIFERVLPMSFGQSRFWFLRYYMEDQTTFNITTCIRLVGPLDIGRFSRAVGRLGKRHEALRTAFFTDRNNRPMQGILSEPVLRLEHAQGKNADMANEYAKIKNHHYDLSRGETIRIALLSPSANLHQLVIGYHHINMDGISLEVLIRDLQQLYDGKKLPPVSIQYPDFSILQREEHSTDQWRKEIGFWKSEFSDIPATLPILPPSSKTVREPLTKYSSHTVKFEIDSELAAQIQNTCKRTKASPFNFYLAAYKALLYRYANGTVDDICIGMADGGRNSELVSQSVGFFLNLLPLRFKQEASQSFNDALKEVRSKVVAALANSKVPFDVLLNEIDAPRTATHSPLFQAFINYRPGVEEKRQFCGCDSEATRFDGSQTAYDLSLDILAGPGGEGVVYLAGQSSLYTREHVDMIARSYHHLLRSFAKNPALRINRPSLHDPAATELALDLGRGPTVASNWPSTLVHRIDDMARLYGSNVALKSGRTKLTYDQMVERTNAITSALVSNGLQKGSRVGVLQDPSTDLICTLLATLRIGAVFMPMEPRLTVGRLTTMVEDSSLHAIVYDKPNQTNVTQLGSSCTKINVSAVAAKSSNVIPNSATPDATAIILYTSGSTGKPKGIRLSQSALQNQIESCSQAWQVETGSGVHLQQSAWSFDIVLLQTFVALANGASLVLASKETRGDPIAVTKMIVSEGINYVQATPSELVSWIRHGDTEALRKSNWRFAMTGGDKLTSSLIDQLKHLGKKDLRVFNAYGPAETTVAVGSVQVNYETDQVDQPFVIFPNYSVYILDSQMQPVPAGFPGEIFIGGAGVAQGYLNNDALNEERFPLDEFAPTEYIGANWTRMHKSGDRGCLSPDGGLLIQGRIDDDTQIKLRGMRIDLKDVESVMLQAAKGAISDAIVSVRTSGETEFLVAHVVMSSSFTGDATSFLKGLPASLPVPQYMQPTISIPVESLPTNLSDKVDRKAISQLPLGISNNSHVPSHATAEDPQAKLKEVWLEVLGDGIASLHSIESQSDFFHIGGSSLALVEVQAKIKTNFGIDIPLVQLFENSTLSAMARQVDPTIGTVRIDPTLAETPASADKPSTQSTPINQIDWDSETALPDDMFDIEIDPAPKDQGLPYKTVAITGSSGFLGKALLRRMIDDNHIDKIHAIALRRRKADLPAIFSDPKVELHLGDLNAPRLGLSEAAAQQIFAETDAVIHNGADVSFLKNYRTLSRTNVGSTRELVKLCLPHRIPIHYISSAGVTHLSGQLSFGEQSIADFQPPTDGSDGYTATKWASERFLESVSDKFSVPIWIHRPSSITGEDAPPLDLMSNMLDFSKRIHKVPASPAWRGTLDFVPVEQVAREIIEEVRNDSAHEDGLIKYLYESGGLQVAVEDMQGSLEQQTGEVFETVGLAEWTKAAVAEGLDELVAAYLTGAAEVPIVFPKLERKPRRTVEYDSTPEPKQAGSWFSPKGLVSRFFG